MKTYRIEYTPFHIGSKRQTKFVKAVSAKDARQKFYKEAKPSDNTWGADINKIISPNNKTKKHSFLYKLFNPVKRINRRHKNKKRRTRKHRSNRRRR